MKDIWIYLICIAIGLVIGYVIRSLRLKRMKTKGNLIIVEDEENETYVFLELNCPPKELEKHRDILLTIERKKAGSQK